MDFERLLELVGDEPVFETGLLLAGKVRSDLVRLQLTRWTNSGRVYQLRRGVYAIAPPYQKVKPHPFLIANSLQHASYVSGQSALAFYGLIPEVTPATISVTGGRPERLETPLGVFEFRHVKPGLLRGYRMTNLHSPKHPTQQALVALPEKALLDLIYLQPGSDSPNYLNELRLQNLERLDLDVLRSLVALYRRPKMQRACEHIIRLAQTEAEEFETL